MAARRNHRVTMWKGTPSAKGSGRGSYSSAACPNGINYCSDATAWASCCFDINGTYTIDVNAAFNYLQNAGFYGDLPYIFLGLMQRESSFTPDVIARCPPCCCTEAGVTAVGLLQVVIEAWPQFGVEWLKNPANNCAAAMVILNQQGLGAWTPLNGLDSQSSIDYWRNQVSVGGVIVPPQHGGLVTPDEATPQLTPPAELPPAPAPDPTYPPPYISPDILVPRLDIPGDEFDGFDNIVRYYKRDLPYLVEYDNDLIREITQLTGG